MDEAVGCPGCQRLQARVAELEAMVRDLAAQVKDLTARLQGKEPPPRPPANPTPTPGKTPTGRQPGGQPGHPPHLKRRLTPDLVTETVTYVPATCEQCRTDLPAAEKELTHKSDELVRRRQALPWFRVDKEYRFETDDGTATLKAPFKGRSQLMTYHFMVGPDYK